MRAHGRVLSLVIAPVILAGCATARATPATCLDAVRQAESDARAGIQGGSNEQVTEREEMKVHLYIAAMAADSGNERECWHQYQLALSYIR